jgi:anti-sigma regulatory factor (Ser/Thr protein kinase)
MPHDEPDLELSIPARAENVAVVRHMLGGVGDVMGLDPEVLDDIRLAVSEACANVVVHAYPDGEGLLVVRVFVADDTVEVSVRDQGRGMAPRTDSPGLGVGLPLIASLSRTLELSAPPGRGTEVRMAFDVVPRVLAEDARGGADEAELGP